MSVKKKKMATTKKKTVKRRQLLDYGREFPDPKKELLLITARFDINKGQLYEYMGDA